MFLCSIQIPHAKALLNAPEPKLHWKSLTSLQRNSSLTPVNITEEHVEFTYRINEPDARNKESFLIRNLNKIIQRLRDWSNIQRFYCETLKVQHETLAKYFPLESGINYILVFGGGQPRGPKSCQLLKSLGDIPGTLVLGEIQGTAFDFEEWMLAL